jgi:hypothetical protein
MQSTGVWSLNHGITILFGLSNIPIFIKSTPHPSHVFLCKGAPICCKHASISIETHETAFVVAYSSNWMNIGVIGSIEYEPEASDGQLV